MFIRLQTSRLSSRYLIVPLLGLITLLSGLSAAYAKPTLKVKVIKAGDESTQTSKKLSDLQEHLKRAFPKYKSFTHIKTQSYEFGSHEFKLKSGVSVKLDTRPAPEGIKVKTHVKHRKKSKRGRVLAKYNTLVFEAFRLKKKVFILAITAQK